MQKAMQKLWKNHEKEYEKIRKKHFAEFAKCF